MLTHLLLLLALSGGPNAADVATLSKQPAIQDGKSTIPPPPIRPRKTPKKPAPLPVDGDNLPLPPDLPLPNRDTQLARPLPQPPLPHPPEAQPNPDSPLIKDMRKWEEGQRLLGAQWQEETKITSTGYRPPSLPSMLGGEFPFTSLPKSKNGNDYYNFNGFTYDPLLGGYAKGYNYDYIRWLKDRKTTFWRYAMQRKCNPYNCYAVGMAWETYNP